MVFIPVGETAVSLAHEPSFWLGRAMLSLVPAWTACSGVDHVRLLERWRGSREPDALRTLADALVAHHGRAAEATYWRA